MKLSIIIPVYNAEKYLEECVDSLFNQDLSEESFEILLINDGSKDGSLDLANGLAEKHPNIRIFHQENQGQAVARNLGIDEARGDYLMFVDADDYILPHKLSSILIKIEESGLDAIIYNILIEKENGAYHRYRVSGVRYDEIISGEEAVLRYHVFTSVCCGIFNHSVFANNPGLRFRLGFSHEDSELCFRMYPQFKRLKFIEEDVYFYRYNPTSTDRSNEKVKLERNMESDAIVLSKLKADLDEGQYSPIIQEKYRQLLNSGTLGFFSRIKNSKIWSNKDLNIKIDWLREIGIYPIKGTPQSYKAKIITRLFNYPIFLKIYLH